MHHETHTDGDPRIAQRSKLIPRSGSSDLQPQHSVEPDTKHLGPPNYSIKPPGTIYSWDPGGSEQRVPTCSHGTSSRWSSSPHPGRMLGLGGLVELSVQTAKKTMHADILLAPHMQPRATCRTPGILGTDLRHFDLMPEWICNIFMHAHYAPGCSYYNTENVILWPSQRIQCGRGVHLNGGPVHRSSCRS